VDILTHPFDPSMTTWFTTSKGDDHDDTLERTAHQALMEFYERHLSGLDGTAIALLPIQNEGNTVWSERMAAVGDPECRPTTRVGRSWHATSNMYAPCFRRPPRLAFTSASAWRSTPTR
jgi:hypothetical protein